MAKLVNNMLNINIGGKDLPMSTLVNILADVDAGALKGLETLKLRTGLRPKMSVQMAPKLTELPVDPPRLQATIELLHPITARAVETFNFYIGNPSPYFVEKRVCDAYDEYKKLTALAASSASN